jgi:hypothetical protein
MVQRSIRPRGGIFPKLTFRFQGRDFRLTDVHGEVVWNCWRKGWGMRMT